MLFPYFHTVNLLSLIFRRVTFVLPSAKTHFTGVGRYRADGVTETLVIHECANASEALNFARVLQYNKIISKKKENQVFSNAEQHQLLFRRGQPRVHLLPLLLPPDAGHRQRLFGHGLGGLTSHGRARVLHPGANIHGYENLHNTPFYLNLYHPINLGIFCATHQ